MICKFRELLHNNFLVSFLSYYIVIMLIPILIGSGLYLYNIKVIKKEVTSANKIVMNQLQQSIDQRLYNVKEFAMQFESDKTLKAIMNVKGELDKNNRYTIHNLINNFKAYTVANKFIEDFFIYFRNCDSVLSPYGYVNVTGIDDNTFNSATWYFPRWEHIIRDEHRDELDAIFIENTEKVNDIIYMQSLPYNRYEEHQANVVIKLNSDYFTDIINNIGKLNYWKASVAIIDDSNNILYSYGNADLLKRCIDYNSNKFGGFITINNTDDYYTYKVNSEQSNWRYVTVIPSSEFLQSIKNVHIIALISVLLLTFIIIIAIIYIKRKRYEPLAATLELLKDSNSQLKISNIYEYLKKSVTKTLKVQAVLQENISQNKDYMQKYLIIRLITQKIKDENYYINLMKSNGINLFSKFIVVIFYINIKEEATIKDNEAFIILIEQLKDSYKKTFDEGKKNIAIYPVHFSNMIVSLINFNTESFEQDKFKRWLVDIETKTFELRISIAVSKQKNGINNINKGYEEALAALEHKLVYGKTGVVYYSTSQAPKKISEIKYYQYETNFTMMLENKEFGKAKNIVTNLFNLILSNQALDVNIVKCRMFGIINILMNTIEKNNLNSNIISYDDLYVKLTKFKSIDELRIEIINILNTIEKNVNKEGNKDIEDIISDIKKFINKQYFNQDLSVSFLAYKYDIDISILSRKFKKAEGTNLSDFIHLVRLAKAKRMLNNTDETIKNIAIKNGYLNSDIFIRVFKRYEGITPGKFRKNNKVLQR